MSDVSITHTTASRITGRMIEGESSLDGAFELLSPRKLYSSIPHNSVWYSLLFVRIRSKMQGSKETHE